MSFPQSLPADRCADAELVAAARGGDTRAFGELVNRYQDLSCSLAFGFVGDLSDSEEIAQEAFFIAWKQLGTLKEPRRFRNWLCGITRFVSLRSIEHRRAHPSVASTPRSDETVSDDPTPLDRAISREEERVLRRALAELAEIYRLPLILFYAQHQSVEHVAEALDLQQETVKMRLSRGRRLLGKRVDALLAAAVERSGKNRRQFTACVLIGLADLSALGATASTAWDDEIAKPRARPLALAAATVAVIVVAAGFAPWKRRHGLGARLAPAAPAGRAARTAATPDLQFQAAGFVPEMRAAPRPDDRAEEILYAFDLEDGVLPSLFRDGWVTTCAPGNPTRHCLVGTTPLAPGWGSTQGVSFIAPSQPPCSLFEHPRQVSVAFDYWIGADSNPLEVSTWSADTDAQFYWVAPDAMRERWGHAEARLVDFKTRQGEIREVRSTDVLCMVGIRAGRLGGQAFYVDNVRTADHGSEGGLPPKSRADLLMADVSAR